MPGYDEALDATCPWGDPNAAPGPGEGPQLIKEAGAEGAKVTVWGNDEDPTKQGRRDLRGRHEQDRL